MRIKYSERGAGESWLRGNVIPFRPLKPDLDNANGGNVFYVIQRDALASLFYF